MPQSRPIWEIPHAYSHVTADHVSRVEIQSGLVPDRCGWELANELSMSRMFNVVYEHWYFRRSKSGVVSMVQDWYSRATPGERLYPNAWHAWHILCAGTVQRMSEQWLLRQRDQIKTFSHNWSEFSKVLNQVERSIRDQLPFAYKTVSRNGFSNHVLNEFKSLVLSGTLTCLCVYQRVLSERHTLEIAYSEKLYHHRCDDISSGSCVSTDNAGE